MRHLQWKALGSSSRGSRSSMLITSTGSWTGLSGLTHLRFGSEADRTGSQGGTPPSLLSSAAEVTQVVAAGGEPSPVLLSHRAPGLKPVRQCLRSFSNSIQEFSQQRKHWHTGWSLNSFLLSSEFFLLINFFFCRLCHVMCSFI